MVLLKVDTTKHKCYNLLIMDYLIGFLVGYCCKEVYRILKYMSTSETIFLDEDWDMLSHDDLP